MTGQDNRKSPGVGTPTPGPSLLSTAELARTLSVGVPTIRRWTKQGCPVALRLPGSGQYRFVLDAVQEWIAARSSTALSEKLPDPSKTALVRAQLNAAWARRQWRKK